MPSALCCRCRRVQAGSLRFLPVIRAQVDVHRAPRWRWRRRVAKVICLEVIDHLWFTSHGAGAGRPRLAPTGARVSPAAGIVACAPPSVRK